MVPCPRCGAITRTAFCQVCGSPVPQPAPPARKSRSWIWIVVFLGLWAAGATFFYFDRQRRYARLESGVEIQSYDQKTGAVTAIDKKTGQKVVMDMNDIAPDEVRLPGTGSGDWIPAYPAATIVSSGKNTPATYTTKDALATVLAFYESEFRKLNATIEKQPSSGGQALSVKGPQGSALIRLSTISSGTRITIEPSSE